MNRPSIRFRSAAAAALLLAAAGCTAIPAPEAPPPAPPPPAAVPPSPAPPPPTAAWDARALDSGAWRYDAGSRTARFVPTGGASPLLTMACSGGAIRLTAGLDGPVALRTSAGTTRSASMAAARRCRTATSASTASPSAAAASRSKAPVAR